MCIPKNASRFRKFRKFRKFLEISKKVDFLAFGLVNDLSRGLSDLVNDLSEGLLDPVNDPKWKNLGNWY